MHAIPAVSKTRDGFVCFCSSIYFWKGKWLLCQSMDNTIAVFSTRDKFKRNNKKTFKGHTNAGYAIGMLSLTSFLIWLGLDASPDGQYVVSGTSSGGLWFWSWNTTKVLSRLNAHKGVTIDCKWHPIDSSKVASCSWDGTIKLWEWACYKLMDRIRTCCTTCENLGSHCQRVYSELIKNRGWTFLQWVVSISWTYKSWTTQPNFQTPSSSRLLSTVWVPYKRVMYSSTF